MQYLLTTPVVTNFFLAASVNGRWEMGIGDPTPMGWITTLSYFLVACVGFYGVLYTVRTPHPRLGKRAVFFWLCCGLLMLALSINKQLDLQSYFTQLGRDWSKAGGWYDMRREVQAWFIRALAVVGALGLLALAWFIRGARPAYYLALVGILFTVCFVVIRAASFHHVDVLIGYEVAGVRMNWILELGGIFIVGVSTLAALVLQPHDGVQEDRASRPAAPGNADEVKPPLGEAANPSSKKFTIGTPFLEKPVAPSAGLPSTPDEAAAPVESPAVPNLHGEGNVDDKNKGKEDDDDLPEIIILDS